jgi:hypothetical protein
MLLRHNGIGSSSCSTFKFDMKICGVAVSTLLAALASSLMWDAWAGRMFHVCGCFFPWRMVYCPYKHWIFAATLIMVRTAYGLM